MAKNKSKNIESTLKESVEKLVSQDIKKEITIGQLKDRLKEAVSTKQIPGLAVTNKVLKQSGKDNKSGVDAIMKKIKDYLSIKDNSNPEFPHQNNSKTDYDSPAYKNSTKQDEYVDEWRGGGMEDLQYNTEPSDEFKERFSQYLDGSIETGNNDGKGSDGQQVANVVPSKLGEKIKKTMKRKHKDLKGAAGDAIPNDWAHHRNPGYMGESENKIDELETVTVDEEISEDAKPDFLDLDGDGNKEESMKKASTEVKEDEEETIAVVSESVDKDMSSMKHLFNYNKKTQ
tara:strand:- start:2677 stop:3537 length:861 start_codon:yes stop_codon:yes gene_type:complete